MIFPTYIINGRNFRARTDFVPGYQLPEKIPISTPLTFPIFQTDQFLLALDKNDWWNAVCGHQEKGESWIDTLVRETMEEVGAEIDRNTIKYFGSIMVKQIFSQGKQQYPSVTQIPVTTSQVIKIYPDWQPLETKVRKLTGREDALRLLAQREDNGLLRTIFQYVQQPDH